MAGQLEYRHHWVFCVAGLAVWLALGWPVLDNLVTGTPMRGAIVPAIWLAPFCLFGAAVLAAMVLEVRPAFLWALLLLQVAAVAAMAVIVPWAMMAVFLIITAWQAGMATAPAKALAWVGFQTLVVVGALAQALNPDMCWIIGLAAALQLFFVYTAQTARALAETNRQLRAAQALVATTVRSAERLRISRELHDAWGHELTALGLQLEIASHVGDPKRTNVHVAQARGLASALLAKVRDVVGTLREAERGELKEALETLARSVPTPAVHVQVSAEVRVTAEQGHALVRCAQEAVTNAVRHARAANLWLDVTCDDGGVRLVARDDGSAREAAPVSGAGLVGMRERIEALGGRLAVRSGKGKGFTVDAWVPSSVPQPA